MTDSDDRKHWRGAGRRKTHLAAWALDRVFHLPPRWLDVPVVYRKGRLLHDGGLSMPPGLSAIGLPFPRRRKSSFIYGAEDDARDGFHAAERIDSFVTMDASQREAAREFGLPV